MNLNAIQWALKLSPVDPLGSLPEVMSDTLSSNPEVRDLGRTPGIITVDKLVSIYKMLVHYKIKPAVLSGVMCKMICFSNTPEVCTTVIDYYGVKPNNIIIEAIRTNATHVFMWCLDNYALETHKYISERLVKYSNGDFFIYVRFRDESNMERTYK